MLILSVLLDNAINYWYS